MAFLEEIVFSTALFSLAAVCFSFGDIFSFDSILKSGFFLTILSDNLFNSKSTKKGMSLEIEISFWQAHQVLGCSLHRF